MGGIIAACRMIGMLSNRWLVWCQSLPSLPVEQRALLIKRPRRHQCQASSSVLTSSRWACQGGETPRWKTQLPRWDFITKRKWKDAESRPVPHDLAILMDSKCSKKGVAILMIWWSKKLRVSVRISCMEAMGPSDQRDKRDLRPTLKSHTTNGFKKN
jgi:hypothetical protein